MFSYLCVCLFCVFLWLTVLVNCLLTAFAICVGQVNGFSLKVIGLFFFVFFCWLIHVLSSKEYVCCVRGPSVCVCIVCHVVRLYNVVEIVVMSSEVACCSVVCDTLVGVLVFNIINVF